MSFNGLACIDPLRTAIQRPSTHYIRHLYIGERLRDAIAHVVEILLNHSDMLITLGVIFQITYSFVDHVDVLKICSQRVYLL